MKNLLRVLLGFVPLGIGYLQNAYMMTHMDTLPPLKLIALGTLLIWGLLCYVTADDQSRAFSQVLALNTASFLALAQWLEEKHLPQYTIENIFSESLLKVVKQCTM